MCRLNNLACALLISPETNCMLVSSILSFSDRRNLLQDEDGGDKLVSVQGKRTGKSTAPVCGEDSSSPQRMRDRPSLYEGQDSVSEKTRIL
jgi:hypothetical protein